MYVTGCNGGARLFSAMVGVSVIIGLAACTATQPADTPMTEPLALMPTDEVQADETANIAAADASAGTGAATKPTPAPEPDPTTTASVAPPETVADIRRKAAESEATEPQEFPNVFTPVATTEEPPKSTSEVNAIVSDLGTAGEDLSSIPANATSQERALWLWRLGQTHIDAAESDIAQKSAVNSQ